MLWAIAAWEEKQTVQVRHDDPAQMHDLDGLYVTLVSCG